MDFIPVFPSSTANVTKPPFKCARLGDPRNLCIDMLPTPSHLLNTRVSLVNFVTWKIKHGICILLQYTESYSQYKLKTVLYISKFINMNEFKKAVSLLTIALQVAYFLKNDTQSKRIKWIAIDYNIEIEAPEMCL